MERRDFSAQFGARSHPLVLAVLVCAAYYAAAVVGLALRFPPATTSVLWPPNALLTAMLLFTPTRRWWLVLLAALPAHLVLELRNWSTVVVAGLFATNCSEALVAAGGVRLLSREPFRLGTVRQMAIFIGVAALFAPLVSSFPDAAIVSSFHGERYWDVWNRRVVSNVLSELAVVPTVAGAVSVAAGSLSRWRGRRWMEASVLFAGLVATALLVSRQPAFMPGNPRWPLVVFLPILLWAALRFGPEGVALSLLATAVLTLGAATHGVGPFTKQSADEGVLALQIFLIVVAISLMCASALDNERRRAERALSERLQFEEVLSRMSAAFVGLPCDEMPRAFAFWLERLAGFFGWRDVRLALYDESQQVALAHWSTFHADPHTRLSLRTEFPWAVERVKTEGAIALHVSEDMPAGAEQDREALARHGLASAVFVPLKSGGHMGGLIVIMTPTRRTEWAEPLLGKLRIVADVLANALARMRAEAALRESRDELSHLTRVSAMGELAASLAHELNQPLTGILSNAQAARHILDANERRRRVDLQEIVRDIVEDAKRARDVVGRMRDLLRKGATERAPVDLNELVTVVAKIVTSDSLIRQVSLELDLSPHAPRVEGDRVQLQQVVLNLTLNALEAASISDHHPRTVLVKTEANDRYPIHLFVRDTGPGLIAGSEQQVFEPFYTTKKSGMGMGLAIARSIVEAHGGSIWAATGRDRGAEFHLTLPAIDRTVTQPWTS